MRKYLLASFLCLFAFSSLSCSNLTAVSPGEKLYAEAQKLEKSADYLKAQAAYKKAKAELAREGKPGLADQARYASSRMEKIKLTYTLTEAELRKLIKKAYPEVAAKLLDQVIADGRLDSILIGGKTYYFSDSLNTLSHLYPYFLSKPQPGALGKSERFAKVIGKYVYGKDSAPAGVTRVNPINYLAEGQAVFPRKKLPARGLFKVWVPLPLITSAQSPIKVLSIYPEKYIRYPLKQDDDIALAYLEIPLQEIKEDLKIGIKVSFTHFEERFKMDPGKVGHYDTGSALYKRYTAPGPNIAITEAIRKTALKLKGAETNPLKIAKLFYDHIVWDLDYSYTPHAALEAFNIPESVFVHRKGYGDCGAQSMYFAALCRAVGIPARCPGGYQLFPINEAGCGSHFWAQVYLPNYGWVPVDTSAGQIFKYLPSLTKKQQREYADYYFGKMDPFRYLIQTDVDLPLVPEPDEPLAFAMVLQQPTAICREMDEDPGFYLMENWKLKVKPVK
jgi:transglutaminase-like putative cysteine protease